MKRYNKLHDAMMPDPDGQWLKWEDVAGQALQMMRKDDRIAALEAVLKSHNDDCQTSCGIGEQEGIACGYRPYFPRRCPTCPMHQVIGVPK